MHTKGEYVLPPVAPDGVFVQAANNAITDKKIMMRFIFIFFSERNTD